MPNFSLVFQLGESFGVDVAALDLIKVTLQVMGGHLIQEARALGNRARAGCFPRCVFFGALLT
ncbi:hypothetical protein A5708_19285 [Mycobacterium colombiense]|uniref:Uncharacterized protein n=1 Tax=Mycobacterium colombiense TaxID=339268 RepID=A0A1A2YYA2_9MYCO|nr:hypothetical protein A5708_19285 [Mycobacterium colombiense]